MGVHYEKSQVQVSVTACVFKKKEEIAVFYGARQRNCIVHIFWKSITHKEIHSLG